MLYILICRDKAGDGLARRMATRPEHLAYLESLGEKVRIGGAMLTEDEKEPRGSVLIVEAENIEEAREIATTDPYNKADVFEDVEIYPWRQAAGVVPVG